MGLRVTNCGDNDKMPSYRWTLYSVLIVRSSLETPLNDRSYSIGKLRRFDTTSNIKLESLFILQTIYIILHNTTLATLLSQCNFLMSQVIVHFKSGCSFFETYWLYSKKKESNSMRSLTNLSMEKGAPVSIILIFNQTWPRKLMLVVECIVLAQKRALTYELVHGYPLYRYYWTWKIW